MDDNCSKFRFHTQALLKRLHWLPISERIKYKIAILTFKTLQSGKLSYLRDLLSFYSSGRDLRSSNSNLLDIPDIRSSNGRRSFSYSAPYIWKHSLTKEIRSSPDLESFKRAWKTHLYLRQFPP